MQEDFKQIDIHEAKKMLEKQAVTIIDIRDAQSYSQGHIENAVLVNDDNLNEFLNKTDKNKPLICYCYHGNNSQSAAIFFMNEGFQEVYSIAGGFEEYKKLYK